jgi:hypothetical protein
VLENQRACDIVVDQNLCLELVNWDVDDPDYAVPKRLSAPQISRWSEDSHDSDDDTPNGWDNGDDGDSDGDSDEGSDGGSHGRANAGRNSSNAGSEMGASDDGEDPEGMEVPEVSEEASDSEEGPRISGVANSDADYTSNASWKGASEAHLEHTAPADM